MPSLINPSSQKFFLALSLSLKSPQLNPKKLMGNLRFENLLWEENLESWVYSLKKLLGIDASQETLEKNLEVFEQERRRIENEFKAPYQIQCFFDSHYPNSLRSLRYPPFFIHLLGSASLLAKPMVSIIGTRQPTLLGQIEAKKMVALARSKEQVVVSGFAKGIDRCAHEESIRLKAPTLAILPGGFKFIYPKSNLTLIPRLIESGGLLLSEYPPQQQAYRSHFALRNRLIACLGSKVIILEAQKRSGTQITARYAIELGKEIWIPRVEEPPLLFQEGLLEIKTLFPNTSEYAHPLEVFQKMASPENSSGKLDPETRCDVDLTPLESKLYEVLYYRPLSLESLLSQFSQDSPLALRSALRKLTLLGILEKHPGPLFSSRPLA